MKSGEEYKFQTKTKLPVGGLVILPETWIAPKTKIKVLAVEGLEEGWYEVTSRIIKIWGM